MRHHVILMLESILQTESYLISEFNFVGDENEIPLQGLADEIRKLTIKEVREKLAFEYHFFERLPLIESVDERGNMVKVSIGQCSVTELVLAPTGIISIFFFDRLGLPTRQMVYDLRIDD